MCLGGTFGAKLPKGSVWIAVESSISRSVRRGSTERHPEPEDGWLDYQPASAPNAAVRVSLLSALTAAVRGSSVYDFKVSLLASASESESTESSDRDPHDVYSSLLESEFLSGPFVIAWEEGTEWDL